MHYWRSIDFRNALQYPLPEFCPGLNTDVAQECSCHFAEQRFDDVEPRSVFRCQHILEAIRARSKEGPRFFRDVCRVVVEDQSNRAVGRIAGVQVFQQIDELAAAVSPFDAGGYMAVVQIQRRQDGTSAQSLVFVIATDCGMFTGNGRQIRSGIGEGLQTWFLIH